MYYYCLFIKMYKYNINPFTIKLHIITVLYKYRNMKMQKNGNASNVHGASEQCAQYQTPLGSKKMSSE